MFIYKEHFSSHYGDAKEGKNIIDLQWTPSSSTKFIEEMFLVDCQKEEESSFLTKATKSASLKRFHNI